VSLNEEPLSSWTNTVQQRLDAALKKCSGEAWSVVRRWIERGRICVDGELCTDPAQLARPGQRLELHAQGQPKQRARDSISERIVYRDAHLFVVNKPAGLSTVPFDKDERDTLEARLHRYISELNRQRQAGSNSANRQTRKAPPQRALEALLVHRLDRNTSGLLLFASHREAQRRLKSALRQQTRFATELEPSSSISALPFDEKCIQRSYLALVHGHIERPQLYRSHLVADRGDGRRGSAEYARGRGKSCEEGQLAITTVEPVRQFSSATLVSCRLFTGRTHQIRIHLAEAGHPLLGETGYLKGFTAPLISAPRQMLHAASLAFIHPFTGQKMSFEAPLEADMQRMLEVLSQS
jgi:23S rRNA pseudouridine1911/1915/1917 synthase